MQTCRVVRGPGSAVSSNGRWTTNLGQPTYCASKPGCPHRIHVLLAACLLPFVSVAYPAFSLFAASGRYDVREVKPHVFIWVPEDILDQDGDPAFSRAGTAGFVITQDGVVVVNTANSPFHAREILYEIGRRTDQPVKFVINTDARGDHFLGNEVFVDQQASIISTAAAQGEMQQYERELRARETGDLRLQARMRGFHFAFPSQTVDSELTLNTAGAEVKVLSLGEQSSSGHLVVLLPKLKTLFLGDLFENQFFPRVGSLDVRKWIETLRQVESWDVDIFVPGHGAPSDKKNLAAFRQFLEWLAGEVETRVREGKSLPQVKSELVPFASYPWHAPELAPLAVEAVYNQLIAAQHSAHAVTKAGGR